MSEILLGVSLILGSLFILIAGVGILKLPDTLCRAHALSKALTFGMMLVLFAVIGQLETIASSVKLVTAIIFQFMTIPIGGHVFALYYYRINGR